VYLVTDSYFRLHNKDGGHAVRLAENPMLHTHFTALCRRRLQVLAMEFSHYGDPDLCWHPGFRWENTGWLSTFFASVILTLTRWPLYTNLTRIAWSYSGCANTNFLRQSLRKLSSDRHTDIGLHKLTYIHTDRQTDRQNRLKL